MTTQTATLADLLLARIAEDEAAADGDWSIGRGGLHIITDAMHARVLAECAAKRAIVDMHRPEEFLDAPGEYACSNHPNVGVWPCLTLRHLAAPYADHPDYREEWRA